MNEFGRETRCIRTIGLALGAAGILGLGACGGGGGSPPGNLTLYDTPTAVAEAAAQALPARGSVTQSSNAAAGVTLDRAGITHEASGGLTLRVTRANQGPIEVSTEGNVERLWSEFLPVDPDNPLLQNDTLYLVSLRDRPSGTFVNLATTRRVSGVTQREVDHEPRDDVLGWDSADSDHLMFGWWLRPAASAAAQPEAGVFVDGSRPFSGAELAALSGSATYAGGAFAYALGNSSAVDVSPFLLPSSEGEGRAQLHGAVELTADFGAQTIGGTVFLFGDPDNYDSEGEPPEPDPIVLALGSAAFDPTASGGFFTGDTASRAESSVSGLSGKWGGQFYGAPGEGGRPPHAAGTFGAKRTGFSVLGVFLGRDGANVDDFLLEPPTAMPEPEPEQPSG